MPIKHKNIWSRAECLSEDGCDSFPFSPPFSKKRRRLTEKQKKQKMASIVTVAKAFTPAELGGMSLKSRVVMAPMTRRKANAALEATSEIATYYGLRASGTIFQDFYFSQNFRFLLKKIILFIVNVNLAAEILISSVDFTHAFTYIVLVYFNPNPCICIIYRRTWPFIYIYGRLWRLSITNLVSKK